MSAMYVWKTIRAAENNMAHDSPPPPIILTLISEFWPFFLFLFFLHSSDFFKSQNSDFSLWILNFFNSSEKKQL